MLWVRWRASDQGSTVLPSLDLTGPRRTHPVEGPTVGPTTGSDNIVQCVEEDRWRQRSFLFEWNTWHGGSGHLGRRTERVHYSLRGRERGVRWPDTWQCQTMHWVRRRASDQGLMVLTVSRPYWTESNSPCRGSDGWVRWRISTRGRGRWWQWSFLFEWETWRYGSGHPGHRIGPWLGLTVLKGWV